MQIEKQDKHESGHLWSRRVKAMEMDKEIYQLELRLNSYLSLFDLKSFSRITQGFSKKREILDSSHLVSIRDGFRMRDTFDFQCEFMVKI